METVEKFIEKELKISCKMEWARLTGSHRNVMILTRVKDEGQKGEIMKRKNMLGEERIFIDHDYTKRDGEI